jgi:hypothetical protein
MAEEMNLLPDDFSLILESLNYTKRAFQDYGSYPSYEFKLQRIGEVKSVIQKVRWLRDHQSSRGSE